MSTKIIPGRKAIDPNKVPIKAARSYKIKVEGKVVTARVELVQPKGRGHTIYYGLRGRGVFQCSAADFKKALVQPQ